MFNFQSICVTFKSKQMKLKVWKDERKLRL